MKFDRNCLRLYGVTAGSQTGVPELTEAIRGGITCVQIREKELSFDLFLEKALEFEKVCRQWHLPLIVNDNLEVAMASGAQGVHLGQKDGSVASARKRWGTEVIIGVSVHTPEEALQAEREGADYLGVGTLFSTSTKADAQSVSLETLRSICSVSKLPVVGIGGINSDNISKLYQTGLVGVAIVSALFNAPDICQATRHLSILTKNL